MSVLVNNNGSLVQQDASAVSQLAAVDTENILGGGAGATTDGQTLVDQLAADDVQAQTDIGQIKTDLSDYHVVPSKNLFVPHNVGLVSSGGTVGADTFVAPGGGNTAVVGKLEHNTDYVASKIGGNRFRIVLSENYPVVGGACYVVVSDESLSNYSFNSGTYNYVLLHCYNSSQTDQYIVDTIKPMLCTAEDYAADPSYEPYWVCMRDGKLDIADAQYLGAWNVLKNIATTQTIGGVPFTVNSDLSIKANGTASGNAILPITPQNKHFKIDRPLFLSGCPASGSSSTYYIRVDMYSGGSYVGQLTDTGEGVWLTNTSYEYDYVRITLLDTKSVNATFYPMLSPKEGMPYVAPAMTNRELTGCFGNVKAIQVGKKSFTNAALVQGTVTFDKTMPTSNVMVFIEIVSGNGAYTYITSVSGVSATQFDYLLANRTGDTSSSSREFYWMAIAY